MPDLSVLSDPVVALTSTAIAAVAVLLMLAVRSNLQRPAKRASFDEALKSIQSSELDIDTALNTDDKTSRGWFEYWAALSDRTGRVVRDPQTPGRMAIGIAAFGAAAGVLVFPGGAAGLLVPLVAVGAYWAWLSGEARKRVVAMEKQLPTLLQNMRAHLQAGSTTQAAVVAVAEDLASPLGDEMRILKRDLDVNVPLEAALHSLSARVPSREMQFFVSSVEIAIRSGSDLDPQIAVIQDIVAQRTRIRQKLNAAVAQVKPTKFLAYGAVPVMFGVSLSAPENRTFWFSNGLLFLVLAAALYLAGGFVIRTMVKSVENT